MTRSRRSFLVVALVAVLALAVPAALAGEAKAKPFRGKGKRKSRAAAISAKRHQGGIGLFDAVAWVAFGAWLATVALWLVEVLP